jgi:transposase
MNRQFTLGVDIAKDSFVVTLLDAQGNMLLPVSTFDNNAHGCLQLLEAIPQPQQTRVILESTGVYGKLFIKTLAASTRAVYPQRMAVEHGESVKSRSENKP